MPTYNVLKEFECEVEADSEEQARQIVEQCFDRCDFGEVNVHGETVDSYEV